MLKFARKIYDWASGKAHSPYSALWLGLVFLLEMVLFLPFDALLMLFCWENQKKRFLYALVATVASAISGLIGYCLGHLLWDTVGSLIVGHLISADFFYRMVGQYQLYESWAVLVGSFLPIPFKVITVSSGFCHLPLVPFLCCVLIARAVRFFAVAQMMAIWGAQIKGFVDRHFNRILIAIAAKLALSFTFFWALSN